MDYSSWFSLNFYANGKIIGFDHVLGIMQIPKNHASLKPRTLLGSNKQLCSLDTSISKDTA